jgi:sugar lactone lactonase YvrE
VAAYHLAFAPDGALFVTGPTLASYDSLYRIAPDGRVSVAYDRFGRPQGIAFDAHGRLHVVDALAGLSGVFRIASSGEPEPILAGPGLIGLAFARSGTLVVASNDTAYRLVRSA